jgi:hypothetical protein
MCLPPSTLVIFTNWFICICLYFNMDVSFPRSLLNSHYIPENKPNLFSLPKFWFLYFLRVSYPYIRTASSRTFIGRLTKLRKATISFVVSVRPHVTTPLQQYEFWRNLIFELFFFFSKIGRENSIFIKARQKKKRVLYMKTFPHLWQYLAEVFLQREMSQIKAVWKIKIHLLCPISFFSRFVPFMRLYRKTWFSQTCLKWQYCAQTRAQ